MIDPTTEYDNPELEPTAPEPFPWPPPEGASALDALLATWRQSCLEPRSFFRRMPRSGDYGAVLAYYLVIGVVVAGVDLFWESVVGWSLSARLLNEERGLAGNIVGFLLSPLVLLFALYLVTATCHLLLIMMRGARHGFETSTRVFAFSYGPAILNAVPIVGSLAGLVWMTVLAIVGLREAHETDGGKAAVAVLVPLFLLLALVVVAVFVAVVVGVLG